MQQENKAFSDTFCRYSTIIYSMHLMFFVLQKDLYFMELIIKKHSEFHYYNTEA